MKASEAASEIEPVIVSLSRKASARFSPFGVEPQRGVIDAWLRGEAADDGLGIGPARHQARC